MPSSLQDLPSPPAQLHYRGKPELLHRRIVAIVGTRRPYQYTKQMVSQLASRLGQADVAVISGGAMGVDAIAHQGAFPSTIYVAASSLDILTPKTNAHLLQDIYVRGLALSEYPESQRAYRHSFIERNRLVVALSEAVVIAQADPKSGSMASARIAKELGRPLYVLPHRLGESEGTWELVRRGDAAIINDIEGFARMFGAVTAKTESDPLIDFCKHPRKMDDVYREFGEVLYEYELEGKVIIKEGMVYKA